MFNVIPVNLDKLIDNNEKFILKPKDEVILYSKSVSINIEPTISVNGYVKFPNEYRLENGMSVEDAILSAGGFENFANKNTLLLVEKI